jgi:hypothetical protein
MPRIIVRQKPDTICPDATVENSDASYTDTVASGGALVLPDTDIEVNGVNEGSVPSVQTIDFQLTDGTNPVTPDSVTVVGNVVTAQVPAVGGLDPDAEAFLTAASISDATITNAIDTLVKGLKTNNLWVKFHAIYPFVGGTATTHKFNLKDPRDLNEAFRLTFFGGVTHSATGADPNGTTGYAETYVNPTSYGTSDIHLSFYSRENTSAGTDRVDIGTVSGAVNRFWLSAGLSNTNSPTSGLGGTLAATTGAADGFFVGCLTGGTVSNNTNALYKNGSSIASATSTMQVTQNATIHLFKCNGVAGGFSNRECAFASIGHGMTAGQVAIFNTLVQAFQTTLGRQV